MWYNITIEYIVYSVFIVYLIPLSIYISCYNRSIERQLSTLSLVILNVLLIILMEITMSNTVAVKGQIFWANLFHKNDLSGKYQYDLGQLSDGACEALEMLGIEVKSKGDDRAKFITIKSAFPFRIEYEGAPLDETIAVGNGTECVVAVGTYEWNFKGKTGVSPSQVKCQITKLEMYDSLDDDVDMTSAL